MGVFVVFVALLAVSASNAMPPIVPVDNSHYVEGQSRYIWMPDGEDVNHLVDLEEPVDFTVLNNMRNGANNQYWLYTRRNPTSPQFLVYGNADTVTNSNFCSSCHTKVIVHGWSTNGNSPVNPTCTAAFLAGGDFNVIVRDWSTLASSNYITAAAGVPSIGQHVGEFLIWLMMTTRGNWDNVHLVGYSLGAHVVGNAGRQTHGLAARVTGLDPAGPLWWGSANALASTDGRYVEVIHTDGGILGIWNAIGDADFYPNGGHHPQPGCTTSSCSHDRSYELFAASIVSNHLMGRQCGNVELAMSNQCTGTTTLQLGNSLLDKRGSGMFGLTTGAIYPY